MEVNKIYTGCSLEILKGFPDQSVNCVITSPPYWGLRNYLVERTKWPAVEFSILGFKIHLPEINCCLGLEETPEQFIGHLVLIFRECKRVLRNDGTLWINIGDSYAYGPRNRTRDQACKNSTLSGSLKSQEQSLKQQNKIVGGLKPKDLVGIPAMLAFALRDEGYYWRQDIIWHKKFCLPESVIDRCTRSHEYIHLFSKSKIYYFDNVTIQEDAVWDVDGNGTLKRKLRQKDDNKNSPCEKINGIRKVYENVKTGTTIKSVNGKRNKRSVWTVSPAQFPESHFATFPEDLIVDCIKAGSRLGGVILDPFMGAGTTALVARKLHRNFVGIELNEKYVAMANSRLKQELGLFI